MSEKIIELSLNFDIHERQSESFVNRDVLGMPDRLHRFFAPQKSKCKNINLF